jgi:hypothetical protein
MKIAANLSVAGSGQPLLRLLSPVHGYIQAPEISNHDEASPSFVRTAPQRHLASRAGTRHGSGLLV